MSITCDPGDFSLGFFCILAPMKKLKERLHEFFHTHDKQGEEVLDFVVVMAVIVAAVFLWAIIFIATFEG